MSSEATNVVGRDPTKSESCINWSGMEWTWGEPSQGVVGLDKAQEIPQLEAPCADDFTYLVRCYSDLPAKCTRGVEAHVLQSGTSQNYLSL